MATKRLNRWHFECRSDLDYVFFLVLLLVCYLEPAVSTMITTTDTTAHLSTTESPSSSSTVALTSSSSTVLNTATTIKTTSTSSDISTTIPATTLTTESHSTESQTTETTPLTEHTTISTSTENTTFAQATTNFTMTSLTTFRTTENVTFSETTTNFTTPLPTTINQTLTSTVTAPKPCDFRQSCDNAYYWMSVKVTRTLENNSTLIEGWLKELYTSNLDACTASTKGVRTVVEEVVDGKVETTVLTTTTSIRDAQCNILLWLSAPANVCCIRDAVMMNSDSANVSLVGQIERVGVCADDIRQISAGQYDKCNPTVTVDVCNAKPQNISCGNSTNVIFTLDSQNNCTISYFYYYGFNIDLNTVMDNPETQGSKVICENTKGFEGSLICNGIVKLNTALDLCDIRTALEVIFKPKDSVNFNGVVSRVAICYNSSLDSLQQTLIWDESLSTNFSSEGFCTEPNRENFNGYCSGGSKVIPLKGSCNSSTTTLQNSTTTPPSFTSTSFSNTTTINATVSTTGSSTVNVTTAVSTTTSGALDADGLLKLSTNGSSLNATQVQQILSQLESLLSGPNVSLALANTSVNIVNNLLDVPAAVITSFSKRAIGIVDTVGLKLDVSGTSQSVLSQSLTLAVKKVDGTNFQETSFSLIESSSVQIRSNPSLKTEDKTVQSTPLGSVVLPASLTQNLTAEQQRLASRVQFNFFQKSTFFQDKALGTRKLNSGILGSTVANLSISGLQKEVLITLRNTEPIPANYVASCVFWDFGLNDGSGGWNPSGCRVLNTSAEETQCACSHLTSFGILLDISKTPIDETNAKILTFITFIGCGISAIFLSITLLTYLAFGKLRKDIPSKILIQLCLALLLLNLVFLLDAWLALYPNAVGLCISTAFFLHYFLLASFTWMALEAVHMYIAIVKVFNTYISRFMLKIGLAGWGIPLVVVIIVIAVNKDHYGLVTYASCWIKNDIVFYVAVVAYFCLVFLLNFIMFIVVMIQLCRIKQQNPQNVQNRSGWQEMRSVAGLTVLLGLTWGFAFFAWGPVNLAFMYLFAIFNTLQGFFIFLFHCALKENVRRQWRAYLCCGSLRLAENSEWSRTATQKINKTSKKNTSSFLSSNSSNSTSSFLNHDSLASETPIDVSNPIDDRIITAAEEPSTGSDVVLNEINNRYRGQRSYK
ncbi:Adhesion G-protein coupled receptor G2 [Labeo rohita]|uniref:Adhesion G-protein coupled receptor G2 n=1 Tax=Labeo rohita TaxID=84645 RepID=A0ABQ8MAE0_LABRO|nr:Adhesion G-protein coupled receptor G2 [Labeo rohita]